MAKYQTKNTKYIHLGFTIVLILVRLGSVEISEDYPHFLDFYTPISHVLL